MPRTADDLSPAAFRQAVIDLGFAYLGRSADFYVDRKFPVHGRYLHPVRDARNRTLRRETLALLMTERAKAEAAKAAADKARERQERLAAKIAPVAFNPPRADLEGAAAIARLADDFIVQSTRNDGVVFSDLILDGWTPGQLKQYAPSARILAYRRQQTVLA